jgi:hypothetical protein
VVSEDLVARLKTETPLTISVLRYLKILRDPGSRVAAEYRDQAFYLEVTPSAGEVNGAVNPLQAALGQPGTKAYNKTTPPANPDQVWSPEQWQQATSVRIGSRKEQVAEIDRLQPLYHAAGRRNQFSKYRILFPIAAQVTSHLTQKGHDSDRHVGVAQLGRQVLHALQHPPTTGNPTG